MSIAGDSGPSEVDGASDAVFGDSGEELTQPQPRRAAQPRSVGPMFIIFLLASNIGWWFCYPRANDELLQLESTSLVGIAVCRWKWFSLQSGHSHRDAKFFSFAERQLKGICTVSWSSKSRKYFHLYHTRVVCFGPDQVEMYLNVC